MVIGIMVIILLLKPLPTVVVSLTYAEKVLHLITEESCQVNSSSRPM